MPNFFGTTGTDTTLLVGARSPNGCPAPRQAPIELSGDGEKAIDDLSEDGTQSGKLTALLTVRQRQIVALLNTGSSNKEIARALGLAEGTVKVHLHSIYQRVGVSNRLQLAAKFFAK